MEKAANSQPSIKVIVSRFWRCNFLCAAQRSSTKKNISKDFLSITRELLVKCASHPGAMCSLQFLLFADSMVNKKYIEWILPNLIVQLKMKIFFWAFRLKKLEEFCSFVLLFLWIKVTWKGNKEDLSHEWKNRHFLCASKREPRVVPASD